MRVLHILIPLLTNKFSMLYIISSRIKIYIQDICLFKNKIMNKRIHLLAKKDIQNLNSIK